ncbi:MAG: DUF4363 family protein [Lachnospiraceae bacterium]|nr:DUF4363 family protein [Lachnospiraceae bacterium]
MGNDSREKLDKVYEKWSEEKSKLQLISNHNEINTIELSITAAKTYLSKGDIIDSLNEIEKAIALFLEIQNDEELNLKQIF